MYNNLVWGVDLERRYHLIKEMQWVWVDQNKESETIAYFGFRLKANSPIIMTLSYPSLLILKQLWFKTVMLIDLYYHTTLFSRQRAITINKLAKKTRKAFQKRFPIKFPLLLLPILPILSQRNRNYSQFLRMW